jgi:hypothetical protein
VDARRTVAILVRESGLDPTEALAAIAELMAGGMVEEWSQPQASAEVLQAKGRLPQARGGMDFAPTRSLAR